MKTGLCEFPEFKCVFVTSHQNANSTLLGPSAESRTILVIIQHNKILSRKLFEIEAIWEVSIEIRFKLASRASIKITSVHVPKNSTFSGTTSYIFDRPQFCLFWCPPNSIFQVYVQSSLFLMSSKRSVRGCTLQIVFLPISEIEFRVYLHLWFEFFNKIDCITCKQKYVFIYLVISAGRAVERPSPRPCFLPCLYSWTVDCYPIECLIGIRTLLAFVMCAQRFHAGWPYTDPSQ